METETYKIKLEDNSIMYIELWFSDNQPYDSNNPGCIGIELFDENTNEVDGGELDYTSDTIELKDMLDECLALFNLKAIEKEKVILEKDSIGV